MQLPMRPLRWTSAPRESEIGYFRRRALQEQIAAENAGCATAQDVHEELARIYRFRVALLGGSWPDAGLNIALQRLTQGSRAVAE